MKFHSPWFFPQNLLLRFILINDLNYCTINYIMIHSCMAMHSIILLINFLLSKFEQALSIQGVRLSNSLICLQIIRYCSFPNTTGEFEANRAIQNSLCVKVSLIGHIDINVQSVFMLPINKWPFFKPLLQLLLKATYRPRENKFLSARTWSVNIIRHSQKIYRLLEMPKNDNIRSCPMM